MAGEVALARRLVAEAGGTAFLSAAVAGSATMAERLAHGYPALALVTSAVAGGCALLAITLAFGNISGGYFNPASTLRAACTRDLSWRDAVLYAVVQTLGALVGVAASGFVLGDPSSFPGRLGLTDLQLRRIEFIAIFGFVALDACCRRTRRDAVAYALAGYLVAATWAFGTPSLANPAVSIAAAAIDPPARVAIAALVSLLAAQLGGALASALVMAWLLSSPVRNAATGVMPREPVRRSDSETVQLARLATVE
ncbi:MAG TPA: aquaporin [Burkholderiales bacterium]|nr:aquaporin [Burkholderiales bacterium]